MLIYSSSIGMQLLFLGGILSIDRSYKCPEVLSKVVWLENGFALKDDKWTHSTVFVSMNLHSQPRPDMRADNMPHPDRSNLRRSRPCLMSSQVLTPQWQAASGADVRLCNCQLDISRRACLVRCCTAFIYMRALVHALADEDRPTNCKVD